VIGAALFGSLGLVGSAEGELLGLWAGVAAEGVVIDGSAWDVWRVYIHASNPMDRVVALAGNLANNLLITSSSGAFYQSLFGTDVEPNPLVFGVAPDLPWDTFVTIGTAVLDSELGATSLYCFDLPGNGFNGNQLLLADASWYRIPQDPLTMVGEERRLIVGQFTMPAGGLLSGVANVAGMFDGQTRQMAALPIQRGTPPPLPVAPCGAEAGGGVMLLSQERTATATASVACPAACSPAPPGDSDDEFSEANGFEYFSGVSNAVANSAGMDARTVAVQYSSISATCVRANLWASARVEAPLETTCTAEGDASLEVVFEVVKTMRFTAQGDLSGSGGTTPVSGSVTLSGPEGLEIDEALPPSGGPVSFSGCGLLEPGTYTLAIQAHASAEDNGLDEADSLVAFDLQISPAENPDLDGDGLVGVNDLLLVVLGWGPCPEDCASCPADATADGEVNADDLLLVILGWT
jgi:hypothetical protein